MSKAKSGSKKTNPYLPELLSPKEKNYCFMEGCRNRAYVYDYYGTDYDSDGTVKNIYVPLCYKHYQESKQLMKVKGCNEA
jgi:hypothetical protein